MPLSKLQVQRLDRYLTTPPEPNTKLEEPLRVISFDVGKTTGVVVADLFGFDDFDIELVLQFNYNARFNTINKLIVTNNPDIIIIENFRLYEHRKESMVNNDFKPVKVIGCIETLHYINGIKHTCKLIYQMARVIKSKPPISIKDKHKKILKGLRHAQDAYKHIRYFSIKGDY